MTREQHILPNCPICLESLPECSLSKGYATYRIIDKKTNETVRETWARATYHCEICQADIEIKFIKERLE